MVMDIFTNNVYLCNILGCLVGVGLDWVLVLAPSRLAYLGSYANGMILSYSG